MIKSLPFVFLLALSFFLTACEPDRPIEVAPVLLNSSQLAFYNNTTLNQLVTSNDSLVYQPADYQVTIHRITYQTKLEDETPITASGVVYLPSQLAASGKAYPMLSYQHPTAFSNAEAPSGTNFTVPAFSYPLYFVTHGYIVVCPDYIGYGAADGVAHRYEHRKTLAQATVDMLRATKEFLAQNKSVNWNEQVFMTGYSEGGYATLSAQQMINKDYASALHLAGSSCGAGPYAMSAFFDYITHNPTVGQVANYLYAWETLTYNRIYGLNKPVNYFFKSPYAEQISQSLDNARKITASFDQICTDEFRADIRNPSSAFGQALADGDVTNWNTPTPTLLIHSQQDEIIPFLTSQQAYSSLLSHGSAKLNLLTFKQGYHVPTEILFMRRSLEWFEQLRR